MTYNSLFRSFLYLNRILIFLNARVGILIKGKYGDGNNDDYDDEDSFK